MATQRGPLRIQISIPGQRLLLERGRKIEREYPISTSAFGVGSEADSMKTPLGRFRIAEKIGDGLPLQTAFKSRTPVALTPEMLKEDDLIMARILWLDGLEEHNANTFGRYIYLHGTNHEEMIGQPASHGCVRMRNADVAELFELVDVGTEVLIVADEPFGRPEKKREKSVARGG